jgi:hypothetical protein
MKRENKQPGDKSKIERSEQFREEMERRKRKRKNMYRRKVRKKKKHDKEWKFHAINRFYDDDGNGEDFPLD